MEVVTVGRSAKITTEFPVHKHGYWEIMYNSRGSGIMMIDKTEVLFSEGDIFILPPNVPHGKKSEDGFIDICMMMKDMRPIGLPKVQKMMDDERRSIYELMDMAEAVNNNPGIYGQQHVGAILNAIGETIYQVLSGFFDAGLTKDMRVDSFIKQMECNLSNPQFDLGKEIDKTGYSKGYFRKVFKEETGESPVQYFNRLRIEHAQKMILQYGPSRTLKDIALGSGYTDQYYFSRVFKKVIGMSPTMFKEQMGTFDIKSVDEDNLRLDLHE